MTQIKPIERDTRKNLENESGSGTFVHLRLPPSCVNIVTELHVWSLVFKLVDVHVEWWHMTCWHVRCSPSSISWYLPPLLFILFIWSSKWQTNDDIMFGFMVTAGSKAPVQYVWWSSSESGSSGSADWQALAYRWSPPARGLSIHRSRGFNPYFQYSSLSFLLHSLCWLPIHARLIYKLWSWAYGTVPPMPIFCQLSSHLRLLHNGCYVHVLSAWWQWRAPYL